MINLVSRGLTGCNISIHIFDFESMHFATPRSLIHDLSAPTPSSNRFIKNRKHFIRGKGTDMSVIVASFVVESLTKYFVLVSPVGHTKLNCQIQKLEEIEESNVN